MGHNGVLIAFTINVILCIFLAICFCYNLIKFNNNPNTNRMIYCVITLILLFISIPSWTHVKNIVQDLFFICNCFFKNIKDVNTFKNVNVPTQEKYKILFITYETRDAEFVKIHNKNLNEYAKKYNYEYEFLSTIPDDKNVYWYKLELIKNRLETNKYDYVMWLDSDTFINLNTDIKDVVNEYSNHVLIGYDVGFNPCTNAGLFLVKNSHIGLEFLNDCIKHYNDVVKKTCMLKSKIVDGIWTGLCYEQGCMTSILFSKYKMDMTMIPHKYMLSSRQCTPTELLFHNYGESDKVRTACFTKIQKIYEEQANL